MPSDDQGRAFSFLYFPFKNIVIGDYAYKFNYLWKIFFLPILNFPLRALHLLDFGD